MDKPAQKPNNPHFSSGPCSKRPGWDISVLQEAVLGRSHRSGVGKARLKDVIELHRETLGIPADYKIGIVPASDTGAVEMALWSMLGPRGVDVLAWESFGAGWLKDITDHLKIGDARLFEAGYGDIPNLDEVDSDRDIVFTWNGTTSGVCVPDAAWIADNRTGLSFCDATSAVFAYDMDWSKLDVTTWSWQKVLGGEAAHGMLVLSPRAVERLETFKPDRALPKIFRMTKKGKLNAAIFEGATINTPSMLAVEDCLDALRWVKSIGGAPETVARTQRNYDALKSWVEKTAWVDFLASDESVRSRTSVCLKVVDPWFNSLAEEEQMPFIKTMVKLLDQEGAAYDIASYRDAPAGLRIWAGATVETADIEALVPWLDWAYAQSRAACRKKAA